MWPSGTGASIKGNSRCNGLGVRELLAYLWTSEEV